MTNQLSALFPYPAPFPGIESLLEVLSILTFTVHLLLVNILFGVLCIILLRSVSFNAAQEQLAPKLATQKTLIESMEYLPKTLAIAVNFGIPPLLFIQLLYGQFVYTSAVIQGFWWLGIMFLVMMAYYGLYLFTAQESLLRRKIILIISISFLFMTLLIQTANATLAQNPELWLNWLPERNSALFLAGLNLIIPRVLHTLIATLAIGGLALAVYADFRKKQGMLDQDEMINSGLNWFKHATIIQFIIGTWYFLSLPDIQQTFLLKTPLIHIILGLSFIIICLSLYFAWKKHTFKTALCGVLLVGLMVGIRAMLRRDNVLSAGAIRPEEVMPHVSVLLTFALSVAFTALMIYLVLRLAYKTDDTTK